MGVLQPWLLALGLGVAVPLLLHLLQRHQGPRVIFPALRYLRRAEKESARKLKLRQWLLMLLRIAVVLATALAAARPFLLGAGAAHEPAAVVIVLDNSMSTSAVVADRRVLDELKDRVLETLANAGPDDRFWLLRAASPDEPALSGDALITAQRVRETEATSASADLPSALVRARAILAAGAEGRAPEIQLLSDLQASELRGVEGDAAAPPLVAWSAGAAPPENHAVTEIAVAGGLAPLAGSRTQLAAHVGGTAAGARDTVNVRLFLANRLAAAATAPVNSTVVLSLPARAPGLLSGRVEIDADALHADDVRWFVARVLPPPVVHAPAATEFLADALTVLAESGRLRTAGAAPDVLVLGAAQPVPPMRAGATVVIVPPASAVQLPALNRQLSSAGIPWTYAAAGGAGEAQLAVTDSTDPLQRTLQRVRLAQNFRLAPGAQAAGDSVLLRTREGGAWAVRGELRGGGRYILLGSPLAPEASSIPTSAAMIPLLDRIVGSWAAARAERLEARPGDELQLGTGAVAVARPDGVTEPVADGRFRVPPLAGVYDVLVGDSQVSAFAVNAPAPESELGRVRGRDLAQVFAGWDVQTANSPGEWQRAAYRARLGLELWRPLLYALLALLVLEAAIAATGARRAPHAAAEAAENA